MFLVEQLRKLLRNSRVWLIINRCFVTVIRYFCFNRRSIFAYFDAIASATPQDIEKRLEEILDTENTTLSVIKGA